MYRVVAAAARMRQGARPSHRHRTVAEGDNTLDVVAAEVVHIAWDTAAKGMLAGGMGVPTWRIEGVLGASSEAAAAVAVDRQGHKHKVLSALIAP